MTRYYIHDLDDNLHHFHQQSVGTSFNHAATRAAIEDCGLTLPPAEVEALIQRGHTERNDLHRCWSNSMAWTGTSCITVITCAWTGR